MKFLIPSAALAGAVTWAARFLPQRPSLPVLAGLLLTAADGTVTVTGSDLDVSARISVAADIQQDGTVLVSGRMLAQIAARLPAGQVQVSADGATMELACHRARFTQLTMPAGEYPAPPPMPPAAGEVNARDFATAAGQVIVAASTDDTMPVLTTVCVDFGGGALTLAATDRYRLAVRELAWQPALDAPAGRVLVPAAVMADIAKTMSGDTPLTLGLAGGGGPPADDSAPAPTVLGIRHGGRELITRLTAGEYIGYSTLLAAEFTTHACADAAVLTEAVQRVGVTAERETPVRLDLAPGEGSELSLTAGSGDEATGSDVIEASYDGTEPVTLLFHPQRLLDALTALDGGTACLAITGPDQPVLFTAAPAGDASHPAGYRHLLCTIRP